MPRKESVGPSCPSSAVWLKTTSSMTSMPAAWKRRTIARNSSTAPTPGSDE